MSRWRAAGTHLGICLVVSALVASLIYFVWYPPPYYTISGGSALTLLILSVDVVLGPLLTLAIFRAGKKGLKFDLAIIALLQIGALGYGLSVICLARPVFVVAVLDRFVPVAANEIDDSDLAKAKDPAFASRSWSGPRLVGAVVPADKKVELAESALAGRDVEKFPQYYVPYPQVAAQILANAKPVTALIAKGPTESAQVNRFLALHGVQPDGVAYVPLRGRDASAAMLISASSGEPLGVLPIDPW